MWNFMESGPLQIKNHNMIWWDNKMGFSQKGLSVSLENELIGCWNLEQCFLAHIASCTVLVLIKSPASSLHVLHAESIQSAECWVLSHTPTPLVFMGNKCDIFSWVQAFHVPSVNTGHLTKGLDQPGLSKPTKNEGIRLNFENPTTLRAELGTADQMQKTRPLAHIYN